MISTIDEQFRRIGVTSSPLRYKLNVTCVKLKCHKAIESKKLQLRISAMDADRNIDVLKDSAINSSGQEIIYVINKDVSFDLSYGVTKISIKAYYPGKLQGQSLLFYNDLSLKKVLQNENVHKYECQLYGEGKIHQASLYLQLRREGDAAPRYNIFAEMATRIQINKELYLAQYPELAMSNAERTKREEQENANHEEQIPNLSLINMTQGFNGFIQTIGPLVSAWDNIYGLMTIRDTRDTISFLGIATYAIVYQETMIRLVPLVPLSVIMFIFYNHFYEVEFQKPRPTVIRNARLVQAIMNLTADLFEAQYYIIETCFYWKSKEKTLLMLNLMLLAFFGSLPLVFLPLRYVVVVGLWTTVSLSSPYCVAFRQGVVQLMLEYGIVLERVLPEYMSTFATNLDAVYIPRLVYILSWIPIINRYLPAQGGVDARANEALASKVRMSVSEEYQVHREIATDIYGQIPQDNDNHGNLLDQINDLAFSDSQSKLSGDQSEEPTEHYRTDSMNLIGGLQESQSSQIRKFEVYQNQRIWMGMFKDAVFPHERAVWSDETGQHPTPKDSILLPLEGGWKWQTNWIVEVDPQFHDKKGWSFANDFRGPYNKAKGFLHMVRRRKWVRIAATGKVDETGLQQMGVGGAAQSPEDKIKKHIAEYLQKESKKER